MILSQEYARACLPSRCCRQSGKFYVCEEEFKLTSAGSYSRSTMIGGYSCAWRGTRYHQATALTAISLRPTHDNHPSTTLPPKRGARDFANQAFPFLACNIRNWEWPGYEARVVPYNGKIWRGLNLVNPSSEHIGEFKFGNDRYPIA